MLVPRSYRFISSPPSSSSSSPPRDSFDEKKHARDMLSKRKTASKAVPSVERRPSAGKLAVPSTRPSGSSDAKTPTQPVAVPTSPDRPAQHSRPKSATTSRVLATNHQRDAHDPSSLPPAVAALLAMTTIPRPKPNQFRRRAVPRRRMSIDELVSEWKADELSKSSLSSSPALDLLLESAEDGDEQERQGRPVFDEDESGQSRSISADSMPSLDADDKSFLSTTSPCTPDSLRSGRSYTNLRNLKKAQNSPASEACSFNHPLLDSAQDDTDPDDALIITDTNLAGSAASVKSRSSFKSNLTASLHALKNAAFSSIASLSLNNTDGSTKSPQRTSSPPFSDDILWSRPFLFPRMTTEVRPATRERSAEGQHGYYDPPLNFEQQEAPYQQALHAPYLAEQTDDLPSIPMQTYASRNGHGRRRGGGGKVQRQPDPTSEAGRALCGAHPSLRLREPRENSDFLRVIVMEMNMRREGKLEAGRARIWLPPRLAVPPASSSIRKGEVPRRWQALNAD